MSPPTPKRWNRHERTTKVMPNRPPTPGPWKVEKYASAGRPYLEIWGKIGTIDKRVCRLDNNEADWPDLTANARLIAQAPAMRALGKRTVNDIKTCQGNATGMFAIMRTLCNEWESLLAQIEEG